MFLLIQAHTTAIVEPISVEFGGVRVHEVPPNGQGIAALLALNILKEMGMVDDGRTGVKPATGAEDKAEAAYLHRLIEVLRLAFADTRWYCADMEKVNVPVDELLGKAHAVHRAKLFDPSRWV